MVAGAMYYPHDSLPLQGFEAVFVPVAPKVPHERTVATGMAKTGRYRVRLLAGQLYQIYLSHKARNCLVEAQEFTTASGVADSITRNFYMFYPDSTAYGGCLAGWEPQHATGSK